MRRQAKPFTVEIRKSRLSNGRAEPLFAPEMIAEATNGAAADAARKLFHGSHEPKAEIAALFQPRRAEAAGAAPRSAVEPRTRILPDLTQREPAPEPAPTVEDLPKPKRARAKTDAADAARPARKAKKIEAPQPEPIALEGFCFEEEESPALIVASDSSEDAESRRPRQRDRKWGRVTRRGVAAESLRAGHRWKRRLPPALW